MISNYGKKNINVCLFALVLYVTISNLQNLNLLAGKGPERPKLQFYCFTPLASMIRMDNLGLLGFLCNNHSVTKGAPLLNFIRQQWCALDFFFWVGSQTLDIRITLYVVLFTQETAQSAQVADSFWSLPKVHESLMSFCLQGYIWFIFSMHMPCLVQVLFPYDEFVKYFNWNKLGFPPCGLLNCGNRFVHFHD